MPIERFVALQWFAISAAIAWLLYLLAPILTPFVVAAILAYICDPLVSRLCALRLPRGHRLPRGAHGRGKTAAQPDQAGEHDAAHQQGR